MLDPLLLLGAARILARAGESQSPALPQADGSLRRAVSTAYYAVFHKMTLAASQEFLRPSADGTVAASIIRRGMEHSRINRVCDEITKAQLSRSFREQARRLSFSQEATDFARSVLELQSARQAADYDPLALFFLADANALIALAGDAILDFDRIPADERRDLLALMLVRTRG